jgi:hypothetical protein
VRARARVNEQYARLDNNEAQRDFIRDTDDATANADALMTKGTLYLHIIDDLQDELAHKTTAQQRAQITARINDANAAMRSIFASALARRAEENNYAREVQQVQQEQQIFQDRAIEQRAIDVGIHVPEYKPVEQNAQAPVRKQEWAPDPENVHDSALGEGVSRRIRFLIENDMHLFNQKTVFGAFLLVVAERERTHEIAPKRKQIRATLNIARPNNYCSRYAIAEMEAFRLVFERAFQQKNETTKNNMHDAFISAVADCSEGDHTVCLVGRISRFVASLDIIDPEMGFIKTVDTYRAEIMQSLGALTAKKEDVTVADVDAICNTYVGIVPAHSLARIRAECLAGI